MRKACIELMAGTNAACLVAGELGTGRCLYLVVVMEDIFGKPTTEQWLKPSGFARPKRLNLSMKLPASAASLWLVSFHFEAAEYHCRHLSFFCNRWLRQKNAQSSPRWNTATTQKQIHLRIACIKTAGFQFNLKLRALLLGKVLLVCFILFGFTSFILAVSPRHSFWLMPWR